MPHGKKIVIEIINDKPGDRSTYATVEIGCPALPTGFQAVDIVKALKQIAPENTIFQTYAVEEEWTEIELP